MPDLNKDLSVKIKISWHLRTRMNSMGFSSPYVGFCQINVYKGTLINLSSTIKLKQYICLHIIWKILVLPSTGHITNIIVNTLVLNVAYLWKTDVWLPSTLLLDLSEINNKKMEMNKQVYVDKVRKVLCLYAMETFLYVCMICV